MSVINPFFKKLKRKLNDVEEGSGRNLKKKCEDIKPDIEIISKRIKKEPDFDVQQIKNEPSFVVRQIKKEPDFDVKKIKREPFQFDTEVVTTNLKEPKSKSKRKRKVTKARKRVRKARHKKATAKANKQPSKKCKKSTQTQKTDSFNTNLTSNKSPTKKKNKTKKKRGKKGRKMSKNSTQGNNKKEAKTLLDRQSTTDLSLFGFRDELEYFPSQADHEVSIETGSGSGVTGKRTTFSSLNAREKVLMALKSTSAPPSSKPKPVIQPSTNKNVDLLGSILESQSLWHSKNSKMKVNEDGSVEVINKRNENNSVETKLTGDKEIISRESRMNQMVSVSVYNNRDSTPAANEMRESLNLNENLEIDLTKVKIKREPCDPAEAWDNETVMNEKNEETPKEKLEMEEKDSQKLTPFNSYLQKPSSPISDTIIFNSLKTEKPDDS